MSLQVLWWVSAVLICPRPFPQLLVTDPIFLWGIAFRSSIWFWWGYKSEYSVPLATVTSPGGEPLIEAELIRFLACGFIHGSWERDLSLPEGNSLRHRNLDFPESRLPLPYHQQGAPLGTEKENQWEWGHGTERERESEQACDVTQVTGFSPAPSNGHPWTSQLYNKFPIGIGFLSLAMERLTVLVHYPACFYIWYQSQISDWRAGCSSVLVSANREVPPPPPHAHIRAVSTIHTVPKHLVAVELNWLPGFLATKLPFPFFTH